MRFANLSQEATQCLWDKWKYIIREILDEFNEDVFHGSGFVRENTYCERSYLSLETKNGSLYIFPRPGAEIILRVYRNKIDRRTLNLKSTAGKSDQENLMGTIRLEIGLIEERYPPAEVTLRDYLTEGMRRAYKKYWMRLSHG